MRQFRIEVTHGQDQRVVDADRFMEEGDWLIFLRDNPQGGRPLEHWRIRKECVVCFETKRTRG